MGLKILTSEDGQCFYDSVTMTAFGMVHEGDHDLQDFAEWLPMDARKYSLSELSDKYYEWLEEVNRDEEGDPDYGNHSEHEMER